MNRASLVVLAAGMGSRFGGMKQIEPVGPHGELLLEYSLYDALRAGFERMVFVIQRDQEGVFRTLLPQAIFDRCEIVFVHQQLDDVPHGIVTPVERTKPWGTGHAVLSARQVIRGSFCVINADDFYGRRSYEQLAGFVTGMDVRNEDDIALVGFELRKTLSEHGTVSRGVCRGDEEGFLVDIVERLHVGLSHGEVAYWDDAGDVHRLPETSIASMNMWAFPASLMPCLQRRFESLVRDPATDLASREFFLPEAVASCAKSDGKRIWILRTHERWMGLTRPADSDRVRKEIASMSANGIYPSPLWRHSS